MIIARSPRTPFTPKCDMDGMRASLQRSFYSSSRPLSVHEMNVIVNPLFQNTHIEMHMIRKKVHVFLLNQKQTANDTESAIELINDWNMQDTFRRFLIKSVGNANRNKIHRYKEESVYWVCPLDVHYVFDVEDNDSITI